MAYSPDTSARPAPPPFPPPAPWPAPQFGGPKNQSNAGEQQQHKADTTAPFSFSSVPPAPAPYPPPAPGPAPSLAVTAAAPNGAASSSSTVATCTGVPTGPTSEEKKPVSGFGTGSFGSSASSGFGGASFGSCSVPASATTTASSTSGSGFSFSGSSAGFGGSSFGSSSAASSSSTGFGSSLFGSSSVPPSTATTASSSGGFGGTTAGFGSGSVFGSFTAQPASSTTTSSLFGHLDPPVPSPSSKSPFGLPAGHQPAVATPASNGTSAFGCSVSYPHPSTFQVPPTSETFGRPFVPVTPVPSVPDVKKPEEPKPAAAVPKKITEQQQKKKPVSALVVDEEEGSARFPSRNDAEFRYRLTLTKNDRIKVWIEDRASKHQWESNELELSEIVPADRAIPMMELSDYFECFKSCLLASNTGLFKGPHKHDLVLLPVDKDSEKSNSSGDVQLELTIGVCVFAKVLSPTYSFTLHPVKLSEMDILNAKIRDQDEEIENLRAQVDALASKLENATPSTRLFGSAAPENPFWTHNTTPLYIHAETTDATFFNHSMIWTKKDKASWLFDGVYRADVTGGIKFMREGLYNIQIVVHHTNTYDPENTNTSNGPFGVVWTQREAFVLQKNGQPIASSFGSTLKGTVQSSPLLRILPLKPGDELRVVYTGAGAAKAGSYIFINQINSQHHHPPMCRCASCTSRHFSVKSQASYDIPKTQTAVVFEKNNAPLQVRKDWPVVQPEELKPGEVLVRLAYTGVCHTDLHIWLGDFEVEHKLPLVGGHEGAGYIAAIGDHSNTNLKVGDPVGVKWLANSCLGCEDCRKGHESTCEAIEFHGFSLDGSFQQWYVSYADHLTPIPKDMDLSAAAPVLCAGLTTYKALKEIGGSPGEYVVIPGAGGGLGHLACQYAKAMGYHVTAIDTGEEKRKLIASYGIEDFIDFKEGDVLAKVKAATEGRGAHATVVVASGSAAYKDALSFLRPHGAAVLVGLPKDTQMMVDVVDSVTNAFHIIGSNVGNRQDAIEALKLAAHGDVKTSYKIESLANLPSVFERMASAQLPGRVVLDCA